eukprot:7382209-Prymnesium_polylepis.1
MWQRDVALPPAALGRGRFHCAYLLLGAGERSAPGVEQSAHIHPEDGALAMRTSLLLVPCTLGAGAILRRVAGTLQRQPRIAATRERLAKVPRLPEKRAALQVQRVAVGATVDEHAKTGKRARRVIRTSHHRQVRRSPCGIPRCNKRSPHSGNLAILKRPDDDDHEKDRAPPQPRPSRCDRCDQLREDGAPRVADDCARVVSEDVAKRDRPRDQLGWEQQERVHGSAAVAVGERLYNTYKLTSR